jgi:putative ABC transport system permease protein
VTNAVPLVPTQPGSAPFEIEGLTEAVPERRPTADVRVASTRLFDTLGVPILAGRGFANSDTADSLRVAVINQAMRRYWTRSEPIGARISFNSGRTWVTVVGVAGDMKQFGLNREAVPQAFLPLRQAPQGLNGLVLARTPGNEAAAARTIRETAWAIDPEMPVENVRTLETIRQEHLAAPKLTAVLVSILAGLALVVSLAGITGLLATFVSQRTQEFGVRMALGATRGHVLRMVVGRGIGLVLVGLALGVLLSTMATRVLTSFLFETRPLDPLTLVLVSLAFIMAGAVACCGPAWRATTVDPMAALRCE